MEIKVHLEFTEDLLGGWPANEDRLRNYVSSKAPDPRTIEEEVELLGVDAVVEDKTTVFPRTNDGTPAIKEHQLRGFFKGNCKALARCGKSGNPIGKHCAGIKAYKKAVDEAIFIEPSLVPIDMHGMRLDRCERPLRASTPQGERVSIASSEAVPAGSTIDFSVLVMDESLEGMVRECLDYGKYIGLGQWRNGGKGRFTWEEVK